MPRKSPQFALKTEGTCDGVDVVWCLPKVDVFFQNASTQIGLAQDVVVLLECVSLEEADDVFSI